MCIYRLAVSWKASRRSTCVNPLSVVFAYFVFAATILNNSKDVIHAGKCLPPTTQLNLPTQRPLFLHTFDRITGDTISWTFYSEDKSMAGKHRSAHGSVRRIGIRVADFHDENRIGRVRYAPFASPQCPPLPCATTGH